MQVGDFVYLRAYGDQIIHRRVVAVEKLIYITTDEEYRAALNEEREPRCVGFPVSDLLSDEAARALLATPGDPST